MHLFFGVFYSLLQILCNEKDAIQYVYIYIRERRIKQCKYIELCLLSQASSPIWMWVSGRCKKFNGSPRSSLCILKTMFILKWKNRHDLKTIGVFSHDCSYDILELIRTQKNISFTDVFFWNSLKKGTLNSMRLDPCLPQAIPESQPSEPQAKIRATPNGKGNGEDVFDVFVPTSQPDSFCLLWSLFLYQDVQ